MNGDVHVRFCEGLGVKFPRATLRAEQSRTPSRHERNSLPQWGGGRSRPETDKMLQRSGCLFRANNFHRLNYDVLRFKDKNSFS